MADYVTKIRTESGDKQIDYNALANLPKSDKTLTKSNEFADAKAVGDEFKKVNTHMKTPVTDSADGHMLALDKKKLDGIESGANKYVLPVATVDILGGVKSGGDITIDGEGNMSINDNSHRHTIDNIDNLQTTLNEHISQTENIADAAITTEKIADGAISTTFTVSVNTEWAGSEAPYTKAVSVPGLLASDNPFIDIIPSDEFAAVEAQLEAWGYIYRAVTSTDTLILYATEKPEVDLTIQIKAVRK